VKEAIVLASPRDLTAGWSYTALSRARERTSLLIHDEQPSYERSELAPTEACHSERAPMLASVARRMLEPDSEQLAIEQLTPAGRADDHELTQAGRFSDERHQEQAAAANERPTRRDDHSELEAMRERLERLRAQRSGLAMRGLTQLEDGPPHPAAAGPRSGGRGVARSSRSTAPAPGPLLGSKSGAACRSDRDRCHLRAGPRSRATALYRARTPAR